jgi:hypothetical protein
MEVPDLNNPSVDMLLDSPTKSTIQALATGLLIGNRRGFAESDGYVALLGMFGRENYIFDPGDPRFVTEGIEGANVDSSNARIGGNFWLNPYANIRNAFVLLAAIEGSSSFSAAQKEAIRGFAKTIQALDFLVVINTHHDNGAPLDVNRGYDEELAPLESRSAVFAHIAGLLNQAQAHLAHAGSAFPFPMSRGYKGFDTPGTFALFVHGLQARVAVYRGEHNSALTHLESSFLVVNAAEPNFDLGVYHSYGTGSGDLLNQLNSSAIVVHPSIVNAAELKPDGKTPDDRLGRKVKEAELQTHASTVNKGHVFSSRWKYTLYPSAASDVPILRNEELVLLRAEANIGAGKLTDAANDINYIRVNSGGLGMIDMSAWTADAMVDQLLYERRYSLLFEGHSWIDHRRHDKLDQLPLDHPSHIMHDSFPIPSDEMAARK